MRVLWTHNFNPNNQNAGCYMYDVVPALEALGIEVHFEYLGDLRAPSELLLAVRRVREMALHYDLVHAQYGSACGFATSFVKNKPVVVSIRGNDWNTHDESLSFEYFHTRLAKSLTLAALGSVHGIISVSKRLHRSLMPHLRGQMVLVQPSPIDLEKWVPAPRHDHPTNSVCKGYKVLFVALKPNDPIKRYATIQQVVERANTILGNVRLSVATGIPFADMPRFVAQHDALLCVSESEGWPNSVKESLACNVPFVATDISDLGEIAAREITCRVCRLDVQEMAENLCEVLSLPRSNTLRDNVAWMGHKESAVRLANFYADLLAANRKQI